MQRYIEQLIGDLRNAKKFVPKETPLSENYEEFEQQMLAIENAPDMPVKKLYGVSYEEFPPSEKLTAVQMQQIIDAVFDMWEAFNCSAELPDGLPSNCNMNLLGINLSMMYITCPAGQCITIFAVIGALNVKLRIIAQVKTKFGPRKSWRWNNKKQNSIIKKATVKSIALLKS